MKRMSIGILIVSFLVALVPVISLVLAVFLSTILNCSLNEGSVSACPTIFGDIGELLHAMRVFGSFLFYTAPIGLGGVMVGVIAFILGLMKDKKQS
jgi:hypothetical protein